MSETERAEAAKRRLRCATALNEAEANLAIEEARLAKAQAAADELASYYRDRSEAVGEARRAALEAFTPQSRLELVEAFNKLVEESVRDDDLAQKIRCELGTAESLVQKAGLALQGAQTAYFVALEAPTEAEAQARAKAAQAQ